jgi:hypothetical protein
LAGLDLIMTTDLSSEESVPSLKEILGASANISAKRDGLYDENHGHQVVYVEDIGKCSI